MQQRYTADQIASALYHIENGGLPPNIHARRAYYELSEVPPLKPDPNTITTADRETTHEILRVFRAKGGRL